MRTRSRARRTRNETGFTLMELLVAAICLAGASVGVLSALRFGNERATAAKYRLIALQHVATELDLAKGQAMASALTPGTIVQNLSGTGVGGTLTVTRTATAIGGTPDLYTVVVTASWNSGASEVALSTIVRFGDVN